MLKSMKLLLILGLSLVVPSAQAMDRVMGFLRTKTGKVVAGGAVAMFVLYKLYSAASEVLANVDHNSSKAFPDNQNEKSKNQGPFTTATQAASPNPFQAAQTSTQTVTVPPAKVLVEDKSAQGSSVVAQSQIKEATEKVKQDPKTQTNQAPVTTVASTSIAPAIVKTETVIVEDTRPKLSASLRQAIKFYKANGMSKENLKLKFAGLVKAYSDALDIINQ